MAQGAEREWLVGFWYVCVFSVFFFNDTATTEIYTLSLHDALPISRVSFFRAHCSYQVERSLSQASGTTTMNSLPTITCP